MKSDVIILGLGAMGSATLYQLAKKGTKVLGIDQFSPPHTRGSSHGDTRMTRLAIGEGDSYTRLALRSHEIWREIERETGRSLLVANGCLVVVSMYEKGAHMHVPDYFEKALAEGKKYGITHEILDAAEIRKRYPQFNVADDDIGYFEKDGGFLRPEECIRSQLGLAAKNGAQIHMNETVLKFDANDSGVTVTTDKGAYEAAKLIITAGPWLPELLEVKHARHFSVTRQVLYWFAVENAAPFSHERFPAFVFGPKGSRGLFYGFPAVGSDGGIKVATEQSAVTTPGAIDRTVSEEEQQEFYDTYIAGQLPGVSSRCLRTEVCMYTMTPDSGFVIDEHPGHPSILIVSACSGHGFKHSAAIGEAVSELVAEGTSRLDLSSFKIDRFDN